MQEKTPKSRSGSKAGTVNMTAATYKLPTLSEYSAGHGTYIVFSPDNSAR